MALEVFNFVKKPPSLVLSIIKLKLVQVMADKKAVVRQKDE
jgi:hypothetical protein